MRKIILSTLASLVCAASLNASGYRIPEQSFASVAKSGASVATTNGADAAYYNPANMAFMQDKSYLELALTYINLPKVKYEDLHNPAFNSDSIEEHFVSSALQYVSPKLYDNLTFGLAITAPSGASKRWDEPYGKAFAQEFSMKVIELNPSLAYKISDVLALGVGARMTYTTGNVRNDLNDFGAIIKHPAPISREMEADSFDFGYNLALAYRPTNALSFATTYRSKIDLSVTGDSTLKGINPKNMQPIVEKLGAGATIPLPAVLDLAVSYDFGKTIIEAVYERTFWSDYKELDFFYDKDFTKHPLFASFDLPKQKNWKDADCIRLGITHELNDKLTLMGGFAYDKTPVPDDTLSFELPGSTAKIYSAGASYKINKDMKVSLGYLYDKKDTRVINQRNVEALNPKEISGKFSNSSAHLVTASFNYEF